MILNLVFCVLNYLVYLDNVAACVNCLFMFGVEDVKEEGNAAGLQNVLDNFLALLAYLADAPAMRNKISKEKEAIEGYLLVSE